MHKFQYFENSPHYPETVRFLLESLNSGDPFQVTPALETLSEELTIAQDEWLDHCPAPLLLQVLIGCLDEGQTPEAMLLSTLCLNNLLDLAPNLSPAFASLGGVGVLARRLLDLEFIDLAEHCIRILDKVAAFDRSSLLTCFGSILTLLDFFEEPLQKQLLSIARTVCKGVPREMTSELPNFINPLSSLLERDTHTKEVLDLCGELAKDKNAVSHMTSAGIVNKTLAVVDRHTESTCRLLKLMSDRSDEACGQVLNFGFDAIKEVLAGVQKQPITVVVEILGIFQSVLGRKQAMVDSPEHLEEISNLLYPCLVFVYENFASKNVREGVIEIIDRLVEVSSCQLVAAHINSNFAVFLAHLLGSEDTKTVNAVLKICKSIIDKAGKAVAFHFEREGVFARLRDLQVPRIHNRRAASIYNKIARTAKGFRGRWEKIALLLEDEEPSAYELNSSGLPLKILNTLTAPGKNRLAKAVNFMQTMAEPSKSGKTSSSSPLGALVSLLVNCVRFVQNFYVTIKKQHKPVPHKVKVKFEYAPKDSNEKSIFSVHKTFTVVLSADYLLKNARQKLESATSLDDIKGFGALSRSELPAKHQIEMSISGVPLEDWMRVSDIWRGATPVVYFRYIKKSPTRALAKRTEQIFWEIARKSKSVGVEPSDKAYPYLRLLKLIFMLQPIAGVHVPRGSFWSAKLNSLLSRKLTDLPLSPVSWTVSIPTNCGFMFLPKTRIDYFYSQLYEKVHKGGAKHKVKVNRESVLDTAVGLFTEPDLLRAHSLDIEYEGEAGTGLGPTLEFYHIVAKEIRSLDIWQPHQEWGLFPGKTDEGNLFYFSMIGTLVGKALIDKKQLDLPFNQVWWKLVFNESLSVYDVCKVDPQLGKTLLEFQDIVNERSDTYKGTPVEDLGLVFVMPGTDMELKRGGSEIQVNSENLRQYVEKVTEKALMKTAEAAAFREGLSSMVPIECFKVLLYEDFEELLCGDNAASWDVQDLENLIVADHGFFKSSKTVQNLLKVMSGFNKEQRVLFLLFATGAPRLPFNGFQGLNPPLTVVKKEESGQHPDGVLPSVMTCQNYLKVPDYSNIDVLRERIYYAISEGYEAFHLS